MKEALELLYNQTLSILTMDVSKKVPKGAGAAILQDIPKNKMTSEIVQSTNIPVTVKTRLGWDEKVNIL